MDKLKEEYIETNGVTLHVMTGGDPNSKLIILLHGFPELWYSWHYQIQELIDNGYYLLIPDQRGYNLSSKPKKVKSYKIYELALDIIGLIDHAKKDKAIIIGHDWGAAVTWYLAQNFQERIDKTIIINVPHNSVMIKNLKHNFHQFLKSWYIFFFQIPLLPQFLIPRFNFYFLRIQLTKQLKEGIFQESDVMQYLNSWKQKHAISSMINWYRAAFRYRSKQLKENIRNPLLIIWGTEDKYLSREMAQQSLKYCDNAKLEYIEGASHWVHIEKYSQVNNLILEFIKS